MPPKKSSKQRAAELKLRKTARTEKRAKRLREDVYAFRISTLPERGSAPVSPEFLASDNSYDTPEFARRGYYLDQPFVCIDCAKQETWTATQQKWWFEVAKGGVWTTARRCRPCRRRERERVAEHKRVSEEGKQRKAKLKAAGKWRSGL
jgi:hypothetical protein